MSTRPVAESRAMGAATNRGQALRLPDCAMSPPNASLTSIWPAGLALRDSGPSMLDALRHVVRQVRSRPWLGQRVEPVASASDEMTMHSPCL